MSELQDFELPAAGDPQPPGRPKWPLVAIVAAILAFAAGTYWWLSRAPEPAPAPAVTPPQAAPEPVPAGSEPEELPADLELPRLDASDEMVRRLVAGLSAHPEIASWLASEDLVTRFVAAVDNVAEGKVPRPHVGFLEPEGDFAVRSEGGRLVIDPASYRRYDAFAAAVASVDAAGTARLLRRLEPLIDQSYRNLGYPERDFEATLRRALRNIGRAPRQEGPIELVAKVSSYEFADPALEDLPPLHKQLLRLGPANLARVQAAAAGLERALGQ